MKDWMKKNETQPSCTLKTIFSKFQKMFAQYALFFPEICRFRYLLDVPDFNVKMAVLDSLLYLNLDQFDTDEITSLTNTIETHSNPKEEHKLVMLLRIFDIVLRLVKSPCRTGDMFEKGFLCNISVIHVQPFFLHFGTFC